MADITKTNAGGLRRGLAASGVNMAAMVTPENWQILLSEAHLTLAANDISARIGRKLNSNELDSVVSYIRDMPSDAVANMPVGRAIQLIGVGWLAAREARRTKPADLPPTTPNDLEDYQRAEIGQRSPSEPALKWAAFADRRGNAFVDRDRVIGPNSAPHNIPPLETNAIQRVVYDSLTALHEIIKPQSWQETLNTFRDGYRVSFLDVQLPRQTIALDSRNSKQNFNGVGEFQWIVHNAGQVGQIGDIRIQDTLQQVVAMEVSPFRIPMAAGSPAAAYGKVRMLVRELASQSITVAQFASPTSRDLYNSNFHFEFDMGPIINGHTLLTPCDPRYIFRLPFAIVDVLTLQFRSPFELIPFEPGYVAATMTYANPTQITTTLPHGLATGDLIYVTASATGSTAIDRTLMAQSGYIVTVLDPTNFTIAVDTSTLVGTQPTEIFLASKRVFLNIRFTSLEQ